MTPLTWMTIEESESLPPEPSSFLRQAAAIVFTL
jgi:hypothetical protein